MSESEPRPTVRLTGMRDWYRYAKLPLLTVAVFLVIALLLWSNAIVNRYRFNVAIAVLGSLPLTVLLMRGVVTARHAVTTSLAR